MNERSNYVGHYGAAAGAPRPQGIVFRMLGIARYSPYIWLSYADEDAGRMIKMDYGHYDVVVRANDPSFICSTFEAITRHECSEISEREGSPYVSIEIIEKEEKAES